MKLSLRCRNPGNLALAWHFWWCDVNKFRGTRTKQNELAPARKSPRHPECDIGISFWGDNYFDVEKRWCVCFWFDPWERRQQDVDKLSPNNSCFCGQTKEQGFLFLVFFFSSLSFLRDPNFKNSFFHCSENHQKRFLWRHTLSMSGKSSVKLAAWFRPIITRRLKRSPIFW